MRYTDGNLFMHRQDDFVARDRVPTLLQFLILFIVNCTIISTAYMVSDGFLPFALMAFIPIALVDTIMIWSIQRARDQMLVTEFQNALFASALSINNHFCLIVRNDGMVVYADVGYRSLYPLYERQKHRTLEDVFGLAAVPKEDADTVYHCIRNEEFSTQVLTMHDESGKPGRVYITVDPILRPRDYSLLRGHPYIERRSDDGVLQNADEEMAA